MRLLPWTGEDGKPCYLDLDDNGPSFMASLADGIEALQLGMGSELLEHARAVLSVDEELPETAWRHLVTSLTQALDDALRVAESRGERLPVPDEVGAEVARAAQTVIDRAFARRPVAAAAVAIGGHG